MRRHCRDMSKPHKNPLRWTVLSPLYKKPIPPMMLSAFPLWAMPMIENVLMSLPPLPRDKS